MIRFLRKIYSLLQNRKLSNKSPSIICNNCTGGIVYSSLNLKFYSPTINLHISDDDFPYFVNNLSHYLKSDVYEIKCNKKWPVGFIEYNNRKVFIDFMHYDSFEIAKNKWEERKKRVDLNNVFIIWMINRDLNDIKIMDYLNITYKRKMLITYMDVDIDGAYKLDIFNKKDYRNGEVFWFKHWFSLRRHINDIDFVKFLNQQNS